MLKDKGKENPYINAGILSGVFIEIFVNEINAASYPHAPQKLSPIAYEHFTNALNTMTLQKKSIADKVERRHVMSKTAIDSILNFVKNTELETLNKVDTNAHKAFTERLKIVEHVLQSESLKQAKETLPASLVKMHSTPFAPDQG